MIQVIEFLESIGTKFELKPHEEAAFTSEDAAKQRGVRVSQIAKCMVGAFDDGHLVVMLLPGDQLLKLKKVRAYYGKRVDLVDRAVLAEDHGLTVGAISPIQFLELTQDFVVDPTLLDEQVVDISSGDPLLGVELGTEELVRILSATVVDIRSDSLH